MDNMKAVVFKSEIRFDSFVEKLQQYEVRVEILDFADHDWLDFDFSGIDFLIFFPTFKYSSNHPLALYEVYDNLGFLKEKYPHLEMFPDPKLSKYYNDKYRQYLFLASRNYPVPDTVPLFSKKSVLLAEERLGYPVVVKNRYGAGGGSVFRAFSRKELMAYYRMSQLDFISAGSIKYFYRLLRRRVFWYQFLKVKNAYFPFFSPPLLAQKFIKIDRDLKTVVGDKKVVEAHWRYQADPSMWKMNIDGGGTGVWEYVPQEALEQSIMLAEDLNASWINIDMMQSEGRFLISEFSPVWHHYAYQEKPSFIYREDYNIEVPLEISLDLERIIVESMIKRVKRERENVKGL